MGLPVVWIISLICVWINGRVNNREAADLRRHRAHYDVAVIFHSSCTTTTSNTSFTQGLRPLCLPCATTKLARSPLKAERGLSGCLGRSRVAHRTFIHRHGRHGRREVLSTFKTVAQRSPRRSVAQRSLKGGRMKAHTSPWSQNRCTVVGHWAPSKKCEHCVSIWATRLPSLYHHCASFGRPMASIERSLWRPLCLHSATTASLEPPWQWFCLHSAFFARPVVPLQQLWSFKEGTRVVLQQLHRNRTFWVPATTERPNHFYGRTKMARRSQPCVKGALVVSAIPRDETAHHNKLVLHLPTKNVRCGLCECALAGYDSFNEVLLPEPISITISPFVILIRQMFLFSSQLWYSNRSRILHILRQPYRCSTFKVPMLRFCGDLTATKWA